MRKSFHYSPVKKVRGLRGLENLGNTCYVNAVLQCLPSITLLEKALIKVDESNGPMTSALKFFFSDMCVSEQSSYTPEFFLETIQQEWSVGDVSRTPVNVNRQQDAHEFLLLVMGKVHLELLERNSINIESDAALLADPAAFSSRMWEASPKSKIADIFHLQVVRFSRCCAVGCSYRSVVSPDPGLLTVYLISQSMCTLTDCLKAYCQEATQKDFQCPLCYKEGSVTTSLRFGRLPPILVVHVSRFIQVGSDLKKNSAVLSYEHALELKPFTLGGLQSHTSYKLLAVTNHHGHSIDVGHYTSLCRRSDRWYNLDDAVVSNTSARRVLTGSGYILWFEMEVVAHGHLPLDAAAIDLVERGEFPVCSSQTPTTQIPKASSEEFNPLPSPVGACDTSQNVQCAPPPRNSSQLPSSIVTSLDLNSHGSREPNVTMITSSHFQQDLLLPKPSSDAFIHTLNLKRAVTHAYDKPHPCESHPACKHPKMDLDIEDPVLDESDVEGAFLENVEKATVPQLEKWMRARRLPINGNRKDLINRAINHVKMGKQRKIDPGVHDGTAHRRKKVQVMASDVRKDPLPFVPTAKSAWRPFLSVRVPDGFKYYSILEYYENIPQVKYSYTEGVKQASQMVLHEMSTDDEDIESDSDGEIDLATQQLVAKKFTDLCRRAILKCIEKGENFLNSGRVLSVMDTQNEKHYFVKAQVQASMENRIYGVQLILERASGNICDTSCHCKTEAMKRCGHIAAVLLLIWRHISIEGFEAVTTTGRPCYWRTVPPGKDPGFASHKQYPNLRDIKRRNTRDPRPTAYACDGAISLTYLQKLRGSLVRTPSCLLLYHIESYVEELSLQEQDIFVNDSMEPECADKTILMCSMLMWELNKKCEGETGPFVVPNTAAQDKSPEWKKERALLTTAYDVKQFLGLRSGTAKKNYLRKKIWDLDRYVSNAMIEGKQMEAVGRNAYRQEIQAFLPNVFVAETGLWKNPKYPQLACSPDGLVDFGDEIILLEIKRLTKSHVDLSKFEEQLTKDEMRRFYLRRNDMGHMELKKNHSYYYQIQMCLDILELEVCHLYVFSDSGHATVQVDYDPTFWNEKRDRAIQRHRELILPEAVLKRTLRHLLPLEMKYPAFHEDAKDEYFLNN